ncbi:predicted protein [Histoplasma capsulatum G186AR]|uniref:Uncharacterized protein n=1 Tax=Ajellomyces capsulatus (strain G186AR / H82 / ATCC MYA-2454 / RMSCC 2432) TaxID=447093 RepID=C0NDW2_AJECG|nr:uncharacterized protein HCBG_02055 [Histoplasma capsulatum G186AR]EEH10410.1 predicted protein [Histoplasma capsulatum G186AR]
MPDLRHAWARCAMFQIHAANLRRQKDGGSKDVSSCPIINYHPPWLSDHILFEHLGCPTGGSQDGSYSGSTDPYLSTTKSFTIQLRLVTFSTSERIYLIQDLHSN